MRVMSDSLVASARLDIYGVGTCTRGLQGFGFAQGFNSGNKCFQIRDSVDRLSDVKTLEEQGDGSFLYTIELEEVTVPITSDYTIESLIFTSFSGSYRAYESPS